MEDLIEVVVRPIVAVLRFLAFEIGAEWLIKLPGWLIIKYLWPPHWRRSIAVDNGLTWLFGLAFWVALFALFR
ncbi:MAG: hypothetical protein H6970_00690 [Gammaproteobacteria bacterium]|nr:hypothetical protein [Gammaproteobacteria bacterium]MCP5423576.1 hypothetical protein [Gammaproteobacteria bacterium]